MYFCVTSSKEKIVLTIIQHEENDCFKLEQKMPFDIFPTRYNITQFIYFWKTVLHVSSGISTHHQEHTQLYLQYLVLVKPLLLPAAIVELVLSVVWELY